jgi:hypothetical protein
MLLLKTAQADLPILRAHVHLPLYGCWRAELLIDTEDPADLVGAATLQIEGEDGKGPRLFSGFMFQGGVIGSRGQVKLFPGVGGMIQPLGPKSYRNSPARLPALDLCTETGETLDPTSQGLDTLLQHWARRAGVASQLLSDLASALSLPWRAQDNGSFFLGDVPEADYTGAYTLLKHHFRNQIVELDLPGVDLSPGMRIDEGAVVHLLYTFSGAGRSTAARVGP